MNILEKAIKAEGGVGNLAKTLALGQSTVSMWRSRGVPKGWAKALELSYQTTAKPRKTKAVANA